MVGIVSVREANAKKEVHLLLPLYECVLKTTTTANPAKQLEASSLPADFYILPSTLSLSLASLNI